jgi:hypothetical protein
MTRKDDANDRASSLCLDADNHMLYTFAILKILELKVLECFFLKKAPGKLTKR